jgi:hypothetical protein
VDAGLQGLTARSDPHRGECSDDPEAVTGNAIEHPAKVGYAPGMNLVKTSGARPSVP